MGSSSSKTEASSSSAAPNNNYNNTSAPPEPAQQRQQRNGDNIDDLIKRAKLTSPSPIGSSERSLLLALQCFTLLDDPSNLQSSPPPFSEMFKWHVLSLLRRCSVCKKNHCSFSRQAMLTPPFSEPDTASSSGDALLDAFADSIKEPAMRLICDQCMQMLFIPIYEATTKEVVAVAERCRGFSGGTTDIAVVDGPSEFGDDFNYELAEARDEQGNELKGVQRVQYNLRLLMKKENNNKFNSCRGAGGGGGGGGESSQLFVNGVTLGGYKLSDATLFSVMANPELKRLTIHLSDLGPIRGNVAQFKFNEGSWLKLGLLPGSQSLEELSITGHSPDMKTLSRAKPSEALFPLGSFRNLQSLTVSGFILEECDVATVCSSCSSSACTLIQQEDTSTAMQLRSVVLVNQPRLTVQSVLRTLGTLPLEVLSIAMMPVEPGSNDDDFFFFSGDPTSVAIDDNDDGGDDDAAVAATTTTTTTAKSVTPPPPPPVLVSQLIMFGNENVNTFTVSGIASRAPLLTLLDISQTSCCVFDVLDVCAAANVRTLRVLRANNCKPNSSSSSDGSGAAAAAASSSALDSSPLRGLRPRRLLPSVSSWGQLCSLSSISAVNFVVPSTITTETTTTPRAPHTAAALAEKFGTVSSLTSLDVSFSTERDTDLFVSLIGKIKSALSFLQIGCAASSSSRYASTRMAAQPTSSSLSSSTTLLKLPFLSQLVINGHPRLDFAFNGAPRLQSLIINTRGYDSSREVVRLLQSVGGGASSLTSLDLNASQYFSGGGGGGSAGEDGILPLSSCPNLRQLHLRSPRYAANGTIANLSSCTKLEVLNLDGVNKGSGKLDPVQFEKTLRALAPSLTSLNVSNCGNLMQAVVAKAARTAGGEDGDDGNDTDDSDRWLVMKNLKQYRGEASKDECKHIVSSWLVKQPNLEEIHIADSTVASSSALEDLWKSRVFQTKVVYLDVSRLTVLSSLASSSSSSSSSPLSAVADMIKDVEQPKRLQVVRCEGCRDQAFLNRLLHAPSLRSVWADSVAVSAAGGKSWKEALVKKGVQVNCPQFER